MGITMDFAGAEHVLHGNWGRNNQGYHLWDRIGLFVEDDQLYIGNCMTPPLAVNKQTCRRTSCAYRIQKTAGCRYDSFVLRLGCHLTREPRVDAFTRLTSNAPESREPSLNGHRSHSRTETPYSF